MQPLIFLLSTIAQAIKLPEGLSLHIKTFDELEARELYALLQIRASVFIIEQNCIYQDLDDIDFKALHLWISQNDRILATCRICPSGTYMDEVAIGRLISTERGKGYGRLIMEAALETASRRIKGISCIDLKAQSDKAAFYEKFGFECISEPYMFEGLMHTHMRKIFHNIT